MTSKLLSVFFLLSTLSFADNQLSLNTKLNAQWKKYEAAQEAIVRRVTIEKKEMSREEWEKEVAIDPPFTGEEIATLVKQQDEAVAKAKVLNQKKSVLNLDLLRKLPLKKTEAFCAEIPKGGMLHVHPFGTLSRQALSEALSQVNPSITPAEIRKDLRETKDSPVFLYPSELDFFSRLEEKYGKTFQYSSLSSEDKKIFQDLFFLGEGSHTFKRFEAIFNLLIRFLLSQPKINLEPLMWEDLFARSQKQKLRYLELSYPHPLTENWVEQLDSWAKNAKEKHGITAKILTTFFRNIDWETANKSVASLLLLPPSPHLVGINLVADETKTPALEKGQAVYATVLQARNTKKTKLHSSMHAGELGDVRNVRDALLLGTERIGHGVNLREDPVTLEYARLHRTPIEMNLISNLRLKVVPDLKSHPFLYFSRLGMKVSLSTDDEGIFETDMTRECIEAIRKTDISYFELKEMIQNSLDSAFAAPETMAPLKKNLSKELSRFESQWKQSLKKDGKAPG